MSIKGGRFEYCRNTTDRLQELFEGDHVLMCQACWESVFDDQQRGNITAANAARQLKRDERLQGEQSRPRGGTGSTGLRGMQGGAPGHV